MLDNSGRMGVNGEWMPESLNLQHAGQKPFSNNLSSFRVLVVDDDARLRLLLTRFLSVKGFRVTAVGCPSEAEKAFEAGGIDLVLLDVMMPRQDGFSFFSQFSGKMPPVIFLTARGLLPDRLKGLGIGASDYITKPFESEELLVRMLAILQDRNPDPEGVRLGLVTFLPQKEQIIHPSGRLVALNTYETNLLNFLIAQKNQPVACDALSTAMTQRLKRHCSFAKVVQSIKDLRQKIERDPESPEILCSVEPSSYLLKVGF